MTQLNNDNDIHKTILTREEERFREEGKPAEKLGTREKRLKKVARERNSRKNL